MKKCANCGAENPDNRQWCRSCMKELPNISSPEAEEILHDSQKCEAGISPSSGSIGTNAYGRPEERTAGDKTLSPVSGFAPVGNQVTNTTTVPNDQSHAPERQNGSRLSGSMGGKVYGGDGEKSDGNTDHPRSSKLKGNLIDPVGPSVPEEPDDVPKRPIRQRKKIDWRVFGIASGSVAAAAILITGVYFGWNALTSAFQDNTQEPSAAAPSSSVIQESSPAVLSPSVVQEAEQPGSNHAPQNVQTNTDEKTTQLTKVVQSFTDGRYIEYKLSYNAAGRLTTVISYHSSTGKENTTQFSYNGSGQLTRVRMETSDWKYHYDSNGQLTSWSSSGDSEFVCEYNERNQLIEERSTGAGDDNYRAEYTYDNSGRLKSKTVVSVYGDMAWTETSTYSYDVKGQLTEEAIVSDWGNGAYEKTRKYSYKYSPLVLIETFENNVQLDMEFALEGVDEDFFLLYIAGCDTSDFETEAGCLTKVNSDLYTLEFFYNGDTGKTTDNSSVYEDELTGDYTASYEDVKITITATDASTYYLSYTASGITLENIPLAYFEENTSSERSLMFILDDYYPDHCGYVEVTWSKDGLFRYSYNALIDGVEDTEGYYSDLIRT